MKTFIRSLLCLAVLAVARPALSATTWSLVSNKSVQALCTTGTEADPSGVGTLAAPVGMDLKGVARITIRVCADSGQTITGGSGINLWFYDGAGAQANWGLFNSYAVKTGKQCAWVQGDSPGQGIPIAGRGRAAALPSGITVSAGSVTVTMYAVGYDGGAR